MIQFSTVGFSDEVETPIKFVMTKNDNRRWEVEAELN